ERAVPITGGGDAARIPRPWWAALPSPLPGCLVYFRSTTRVYCGQDSSVYPNIILDASPVDTSLRRQPRSVASLAPQAGGHWARFSYRKQPSDDQTRKRRITAICRTLFAALHLITGKRGPNAARLTGPYCPTLVPRVKQIPLALVRLSRIGVA